MSEKSQPLTEKPVKKLRQWCITGGPSQPGAYSGKEKKLLGTLDDPEKTMGIRNIETTDLVFFSSKDRIAETKNTIYKLDKFADGDWLIWLTQKGLLLSNFDFDNRN